MERFSSKPLNFYVPVLVLLLLTSGRDPGIIPRNAHPPEPEGFEGSLDVGAGQTPQLRLPRIKEVDVNGITVKNGLITTAPGLDSALDLLHMRTSDIDMIGGPTHITKECSIISRRYSAPAYPNQRTISGQRCQWNQYYLPARSVGAGFMSPSMGKAVEDIEMGRKTVWGDMGTGIDHSEGQLNNRLAIKDGEFGELSPAVDDMGDRAGIHPRRSSWGRKSGSWEMSPEVLALAARVGEPNRVGGSSSLTTENRHT
ncbi:hypothetical protein SESBI_27188 [Sesbania bispinosa]|nr:hypothetical protein SESBI_27188 [Sesbania bispinosa]